MNKKNKKFKIGDYVKYTGPAYHLLSDYVLREGAIVEFLNYNDSNTIKAIAHRTNKQGVFLLISSCFCEFAFHVDPKVM